MKGDEYYNGKSPDDGEREKTIQRREGLKQAKADRRKREGEKLLTDLGKMATKRIPVHVKAGDLVQHAISGSMLNESPVFLVLDTNAVGCRPHSDTPTAGWKVLTPKGMIDIIAFSITDLFKKVSA